MITKGYWKVACPSGERMAHVTMDRNHGWKAQFGPAMSVTQKNPAWVNFKFTEKTDKETYEAFKQDRQLGERHTAVAKLEEMKSVFAIKEEEDELTGELISPWQWVSFRCDNVLFKNMLIDVVIEKHSKWSE